MDVLDILIVCQEQVIEYWRRLRTLAQKAEELVGGTKGRLQAFVVSGVLMTIFSLQRMQMPGYVKLASDFVNRQAYKPDAFRFVITGRFLLFGKVRKTYTT